MMPTYENKPKAQQALPTAAIAHSPQLQAAAPNETPIPRDAARCLVAVDLSDQSATLVRIAGGFAQAMGQRLHLLHVVEPLPVTSLTSTPYGICGRSYEEHALARAHTQLREWSARIDASSQACLGTPGFDILENSHQEDVRLVAMATHCQTGLTRGLLGSITEWVVRRSPKPVLTINPSTPDPTQIRRILWPTDLSECSIKVAPTVAEWSRRFGAEVEILVVIDPEHPIVWSPAAEPATTPEVALETLPVDQRNDLIRERLGAQLDPLEHFVITHRVGNASDEIVRRAAEDDIDLIMMTTHGHNGCRRLFLGSTTEGVIREATVPVLSVR